MPSVNGANTDKLIQFSRSCGIEHNNIVVMLNDVMLNDVMLNVVMLNVIMLMSLY